MKKKILFIFLLIISIFFTNVAITLAATKIDLQNQQSNINDKIEEKKNQISQVEQELSEKMKQIQSLTSQISEYQNQISDLDSQLSELDKSITETQTKLEAAEKEYKEQEERLQARIVAQYEAGETTYLDVILGGGSLWDMVSNWFMVSEIAEKDNELLEQIESNKKEIEEAKKSLETSKEQVEAIRTSKKNTANSLKNSEILKQQEVAKLSDSERTLQSELDQFEKDKQAIQNQLAEIARKEANSGNSGPIITGNPSSSGYIFPVAGLGKGNINNRNYPSYSGHTGVDVNINVTGKSVVAVKSGTVEISKSTYGSIPNYNANGEYVGSYSSYGEYIVINHHDGTMTLYGHMKPGSRAVSVGQEVSQGQVIGTVGNTGNCLPRPTPSNPYNGTHLHFEVRINGRPVNPLPYLP